VLASHSDAVPAASWAAPNSGSNLRSALSHPAAGPRNDSRAVETIEAN
jgi:hypothetical protein